MHVLTQSHNIYTIFIAKLTSWIILPAREETIVQLTMVPVPLMHDVFTKPLVSEESSIARSLLHNSALYTSTSSTLHFGEGTTLPWTSMVTTLQTKAYSGLLYMIAGTTKVLILHLLPNEEFCTTTLAVLLLICVNCGKCAMQSPTA